MNEARETDSTMVKMIVGVKKNRLDICISDPTADADHYQRKRRLLAAASCMYYVKYGYSTVYVECTYMCSCSMAALIRLFRGKPPL